MPRGPLLHLNPTLIKICVIKQVLESFLPPRAPFVAPTGDMVEDADLHEYEVNENSATNQDSDDEDSHGGARVGCAQQ